jgi:molybdopterin molybdotransferase
MARILIEITEARRRVLERCKPLADEGVTLEQALGRVLAEDVTSGDDVPGFDNSAMDGFAVQAADTRGATPTKPATLRVVDESRAGAPASARLGVGEAIAISTGGMLPAGADAVVRVEDTAPADGGVDVAVEVDPGRDVRRAGDDLRAGERVLFTGSTLGPAELGVLASVGRESIRCSRRPRVAVLTTGDELLAPSEPLRPGGVRNTNAYSVSALVARAGAELASVDTAADDPAAVRAGVQRALGADVAVVCGGVSVGEHDAVRPAFAALGAEEVFWGVALRPGRPTWFGVHAGGPGDGGALIFGLPGNPVSAVVTFILLARPAIRALLGAPPADPLRATAVLDDAYEKLPGRAHAVRCRLELRDDGWHARPTGDQGSHVLTSMLGADALAIVPTESGSVPAGERVAIEVLE